ncbi:Hypothetical predicted protein [Podarcis lilfordi]|uniref:Uncharacterized protein n=1 Tax=Podarcis lilfordi TaxID=74358 RepID=A0AA35LAZ9_9SAUR|nr:Hypothetical predicted protein [Podarcis lilfordi]
MLENKHGSGFEGTCERRHNASVGAKGSRSRASASAKASLASSPRLLPLPSRREPRLPAGSISLRRSPPQRQIPGRPLPSPLFPDRKSWLGWALEGSGGSRGQRMRECKKASLCLYAARCSMAYSQITKQWNNLKITYLFNKKKGVSFSMGHQGHNLQTN